MISDTFRILDTGHPPAAASRRRHKTAAGSSFEFLAKFSAEFSAEFSADFPANPLFSDSTAGNAEQMASWSSRVTV